MLRKSLFVLPALALVLVALFGTAGKGAQAASTINVKAGGGETGYAVNLFAPGTVYVQPGDSVKWSFPWLEPHTVTFGVPAGDPTGPLGGAAPSWDGTGAGISSGFPDGPTSTYTVTFPKKGSFDYFCAIHPGMLGQVVVQTPDLGQPDNQASVDARGDAVIKSGLAELKAVAAGMNATPVAITPKQGGGKKFTVSISSNRDVASGDIQQFFPASVNIGVNDDIEWVSNVHTPHTVTFVPPSFDPSGPPPPGLETYDPFEASFGVPADHKLSSPNTFLSTQVMGLGFGDTKFALTFTAAGTYTYLCILHVDQGMMAKVVVGGQGAAPGAPNTGTSAQAQPDGSTGMWLIFGAIAMVAAASAGAFAVTRR